jgi:hypothetical protein
LFLYCFIRLTLSNFILIFRIADNHGNLAVSVTTDKNIKKLINKFDKPRTKEKRITSAKKEELKESDKYSFLKVLDYTPPKPPKVFGYLEKMGKLVINFNKRYVEVDPIVGSMRRFKSHIDYPMNCMYIV